VAGWSLIANGSSDADVSLARVSPTGEVLWQSVGSHAPENYVQALTVTVDGAYVFGEAFYDTSSDAWSDLLGIQFDLNGQQLDAFTMGGTRGESIEAAAATPAGDIFVAGGTAHTHPGILGKHRGFVMAWPPAPP
jgi:hypothetical protein